MFIQQPNITNGTRDKGEVRRQITNLGNDFQPRKTEINNDSLKDETKAKSVKNKIRMTLIRRFTYIKLFTK